MEAGGPAAAAAAEEVDGGGDDDGEKEKEQREGFSLFPMLPRELRAIIWKYAGRVDGRPRTIEVIVDMEPLEYWPRGM